MARTIFAGLLIINGWMFWKRVLPVYKESFSNEHEIQTASQTLFLTLSSDWLHYNHGYELVFSPAIETETRKRGADIDQKRKNKEINYCYPADDMPSAVRVWGKKHFRWFQDIR
jgi:hypothetical protein